MKSYACLKWDWHDIQYIFIEQISAAGATDQYKYQVSTQDCNYFDAHQRVVLSTVAYIGKYTQSRLQQHAVIRR